MVLDFAHSSLAHVISNKLTRPFLSSQVISDRERACPQCLQPACSCSATYDTSTILLPLIKGLGLSAAISPVTLTLLWDSEVFISWNKPEYFRDEKRTFCLRGCSMFTSGMFPAFFAIPELKNTHLLRVLNVQKTRSHAKLQTRWWQKTDACGFGWIWE